MSEKKPLIERKGPYRAGDVAAERYDVREWLDTSPLCWSYEAFDQEDERAVRLRVVRQTILPRMRDHQAFQRRLEPVLGVALPGVATHYRVEREEGKTLVISELIDGLPLRTLIDNRRQESRAFSAIETLAVLGTISDALGAAAAVSVHGDLQPRHVKLLQDSLALESLGLASALPAEETIRALRAAPDGAGYLAPEVLDGQVGDPRSDVYSLAMIAGELLTGRIPPAGDVGMEEFLGHLPPLADDVIRQGLRANLDERESTPAELVSSLAAVLGAETWRTQNPFVEETAAPVPKDPAEPVQPAEDGTTPFSKPAANVFVPPPPQPRVVADDDVDDAEITQKNEASAVARAVAALEEEEEQQAAAAATQEHVRDPRVPVAPSADGTQQITADMLEPDTTLEDLEMPKTAGRAAPGGLERDPATPVAPSPDGTQQITADMFEPFDDGRVTDELPKQAAAQASLGLDPKLVRAARKLDRARDDEIELIDEEDVQTVVDHSGPRSLRPPRPKPSPPAPAPQPALFPSEESLRTERVAPPHMPENRVVSGKALADAPELNHGTSGDSAHRFMQSDRKADSEDLPAVMLDDSLKKLSGPDKPRGEVTHRVKRPTALRHDQPRPPRPEPKLTRPGPPTWLRWAVLAALLGGSALLLCLLVVLLMR